jgi:hypothetical protein
MVKKTPSKSRRQWKRFANWKRSDNALEDAVIVTVTLREGLLAAVSPSSSRLGPRGRAL